MYPIVAPKASSIRESVGVPPGVPAARRVHLEQPPPVFRTPSTSFPSPTSFATPIPSHLHLVCFTSFGSSNLCLTMHVSLRHLISPTPGVKATRRVREVDQAQHEDVVVGEEERQRPEDGELEDT